MADRPVIIWQYGKNRVVQAPWGQIMVEVQDHRDSFDQLSWRSARSDETVNILVMALREYHSQADPNVVYALSSDRRPGKPGTFRKIKTSTAKK